MAMFVSRKRKFSGSHRRSKRRAPGRFASKSRVMSKPMRFKKRGRSFKKRRSISGTVMPYGIGGSVSYFNRRRKSRGFPFKILKTAPRFVYSSSFSGRAVANVSNQSVSTIADIYAVTDVANMLSSVPSTGKANNIYLQKATIRARFTNQDKGNAELQLYDIVARRDANDSSVNYPDTAFKNGMSDLTFGTTSSYTDVNTYPYDSPAFTKYFKVLKCTKFILAAGQSHTHISNIAANYKASH